jgi:histidyl-tRNA synthetase
MPALRAPRGTRDLLPSDRAVLARLEAVARDLAGRYGYREMETPLFEHVAVFERGIGEVTDVVEKELFRLAPRSDDGDVFALRPEATAGIVRAYLQHGLQTLPQPVKVSLVGPMFRHDRPQAGRYRQFWQWDVEAIGDPGPAVDAELVELGARFYREAGLDDVEILLNSIGDATCRPAYVEALRAHFRPHADRLPPVERARLETNPLRLLDSKDPRMVDLNATAPSILDHLCAACEAHFTAVRAHLDELAVAYRIDPRLVRGLDYYTRTTVEYYRRGESGQQQALGGGGRYDGLVELLGGRPTPGIGFALGLDRVMLALEQRSADGPSDAEPLAVVVGADPAATAIRLGIATTLRSEGLTARSDLSVRKLGRQLEAAARDGAHFAVIVGDELADGDVQLRDLEAGTQRTVRLDDLPKELRRAASSHHHGTADRH